jgi:AcrR family transcriptional regulator
MLYRVPRPVAGPDRARRARVLERSARREELLDAADRIVQRDGPAASMRAMAAEAGITKPVLYRYFGDKNGLLAALADRHTLDLLERLRAALRSSDHRRGRAAATIDAYLRSIEDRPQVYRFLLYGPAAAEAGLPDRMQSFTRRIGDELAEGIVYDLQLDEAKRPLAAAWAHGIVGMVQAAGDHWLATRDLSRPEMVDALTGLLWGQFARIPDLNPAVASP